MFHISILSGLCLVIDVFVSCMLLVFQFLLVSDYPLGWNSYLVARIHRYISSSLFLCMCQLNASL